MSLFPHVAFEPLSDIGRKRKNNEDACYWSPTYGVWAVSDGMGGSDDGEVASRKTVEGVDEFLHAHPLPKGGTWNMDDLVKGLRWKLSEVSAWIYARAKERRLKGCGATFVALVLDAANPEEAVALHAGDSRLYRIRGRSIEQVTKDHSAAAMIGAKNESEINPMFRGMILRAVGIQPTVELERTPVPLKSGDWVLLCSDGLSRMVPDRQIADIVRESASPKEGVKRLVAAANEAGGVDNITAVLVKIGDFPPPVPAFSLALKEPPPPAAPAAADAMTGNTAESMTFGSASSDDTMTGSVTEPAMTFDEAALDDEAKTLETAATSAPPPDEKRQERRCPDREPSLGDAAPMPLQPPRSRVGVAVVTAALLAAALAAATTWFFMRQKSETGEEVAPSRPPAQEARQVR